MMTTWCVQACGLNTLVVYFNVETHVYERRNVTIRSEIETMNIRSLGFRDVREGVTLRRLILWSLRCIFFQREGQVLFVKKKLVNNEELPNVAWIWCFLRIFMGLFPTFDPAQEYYNFTLIHAMFKVHQVWVFRLMAWNLVKQHQRTLNTNLGWMIVYLYSLCFWSQSNALSKFLEKNRRTPTPTKPKREELLDISICYDDVLINDSNNLQQTHTNTFMQINSFAPFPLSHSNQIKVNFQFRNRETVNSPHQFSYSRSKIPSWISLREFSSYQTVLT